MSRAKDFGAVGDGQADDWEALQHAIDDGDGALELTKGSYRITRSLVLDTTKHGYLSIVGKHGTGRLMMDGPGPAVRVLGSHLGTATPGSVRPETWEKERMPMLVGLEIVGKHPQADGIQLVRTMQATLQNVLIRKCRVGVRLSERNRNFLLTASHIYDCHDTGVLFDDCNLHQVIISGNHISYCKRAGIRQFNGDVHNIQITGNDIEYNSGCSEQLTSGEIVLEAPEAIISEYTITGNTLQATLDARGANVLVVGSAQEPPTAVRLVTISGNVLGSRERNIVVRHGSRVAITGNTIYGGTLGNIELRATTDTAITGNSLVTRPLKAALTTDGIQILRSRRIHLANNILHDVQVRDTDAAVHVQGSEQVSVVANQISNAQPRGIQLVDSVRCRISDNSIIDDRSDPKLLHAIRVVGESQENLIDGNVCSGAIVGAIEASDSQAQQVNNTQWK